MKYTIKMSDDGIASLLDESGATRARGNIGNITSVCIQLNSLDPLAKALQGLINAGSDLKAWSEEWDAAHAALKAVGMDRTLA